MLFPETGGGPVAVRAVTFDAVGTLLRPRESVGETYAKIAARHGLALDPADLEVRFVEAFGSAPPLCFPSTPQHELPRAERAWWRSVVARVFAAVDPQRVEAVFEDLFAYYGEAKAWFVFEDVHPTLRALRELGLALGIVSNFDARLWALCDELELTPWFRSIVISSRAGAAKPDPAIFRLALRRLDAEPRSALHVGDSYNADVLGAMAVGMQALWLQRRRPSGGLRIATLHEVVRWVSDTRDRGSG